jgi:uncharacterized protein YkwD
VDPFAVGVIFAVAVAVLGAVLSAKASAGKPLSEFGQRPDSRPAASSHALDNQDLEQMLAATNALRRARGLPERSLADAIREFETE